MSYRVTAPLVLVQDGAGRHFHAYFGAVVDLIEKQAAHLLGLGMVEKVDSAATPLHAEVTQQSPAPEPPANPTGSDQKPLQTATEAVLREWLSQRDCGHTTEELAAMSRDDLRALVDAL